MYKRQVQQAASAAPLRINVNCAGIGWVQRTIDRQGEPHDFEAFKTVVTINLIGTFNVMRLAASAISKSEPLHDGERGVVINTASVAAFEGQIGQISYSEIGRAHPHRGHGGSPREAVRAKAYP